MSVLYLSFYFNLQKYRSVYFSRKLMVNSYTLIIIYHGALTIITMIASLGIFLLNIRLYFEAIQGDGNVKQYLHIYYLYNLSGSQFLLYHLRSIYILSNKDESP